MINSPVGRKCGSSKAAIQHEKISDKSPISLLNLDEIGSDFESESDDSPSDLPPRFDASRVTKKRKYSQLERKEVRLALKQFRNLLQKKKLGIPGIRYGIMVSVTS